ncbi:Plant cysteine oxidase 2 [Rhynchospora pubera]|uniref:cysteine dioxygenase n=1 Tax=Rhynchospora pubera TaxID=906938 RepID=A0AAV8BW72_9POAL|nr:Plant cysteine oxidase 2 [Rhynchospora pubera]KAJ4747458.1 Plant cysteine oxidase 2 [Rhynchospora pubera]
MALHDESIQISRVQRLYDACNRVFSSGEAGLPTIRHIRWLQEFLDKMEPGDVGIDAMRDDEGSVDSESSPTSRNGLILGKTVKQITYIHIHECEDFSVGGLAKVVSDNQLLDARSKASVLFPKSGGNMHSFYAETPCAILDVLAPPYSEANGRPSTYYTDIPIPNLPGYVVLEETELPDNLTVRGAPYMGPELSVDIEFC